MNIQDFNLNHHNVLHLRRLKYYKLSISVGAINKKTTRRTAEMLIKHEAKPNTLLVVRSYAECFILCIALAMTNKAML